jgi:hypothetical protein
VSDELLERAVNACAMVVNSWESGDLAAAANECAAVVDQFGVDMASENTDPRTLGGDIAGPGGAYEEGGVVVDTRHAVLMDGLGVAKLDNRSDGRELIGLRFEGKINHSEDRASVLLLGDLDALAAIIVESQAIAGRMGKQKELADLLTKRWKEQA